MTEMTVLEMFDQVAKDDPVRLDTICADACERLEEAVADVVTWEQLESCYL
jgi:hypothetical protein